MDVTPFYLGVKVSEGKMDIIIPRNITIPCHKICKFNTTKDNQDKFIINIYQGENKYVKDTVHLGTDFKKLNLLNEETIKELNEKIELHKIKEEVKGLVNYM